MAGNGTAAGPTGPDRWLEAWMRRVWARPRLALGALGALVVLAALAAARLGVDADSSRMLSPALPAQERALALNAAFPALKNALVVVVRADGPDAADLVVRDLAARLRDGGEWIEAVFSPAESRFFAAHGFLYRDTDAVGGMFTRISNSANLIARLRADQSAAGFAEAVGAAAELAARADLSQEALARLYDEAAAVFEAASAGRPGFFGWSAVLDPGAASGPVTRTLTVTPRLDLSRLSPARPALDEIEAAIAALPPALAEGVEIGVTGEPALRADEMQSVLGTIGLSMALSLALVAAILRVALGSTGRAALAVGALVAGIVLTAGFAGVAVGALNLVSVAFVVLMVGLGIDYAIHIMAHVVEMRRHGTAPAEAVALTGRRTGLALTLSAVTTALAFLAFATTDFDGMAQLGLIGGAGVVIAFAVAATLIPAAMALAPGLTDAPGGPAQQDSGRAPPGRLSALLPTLLPTAVLVAGAVAILPALGARFDADPMGLRDPASPSVETFQLLAADPATTPYRASILTPSPAAAAETAARFKGIAGVGGAISIADLVPKAQDEKLMLLDIAAPSIDHAMTGTPTELMARPDADAPLADLAARLRAEPGAAGRLAGAIDAYLAGTGGAAAPDLSERLFRAFPMMLDRLGAMLEADFVTVETLPAALRERFVGPGGSYRVEILPEGNLADPDAVRAFADAVEAVDARAAGGPVQLAAAGRSVGWAMLQATLLAALATLVLAYLATRRLSDTAAILVPLAVAGVLTAAASVLLAMPFNFANVIVLPLLIGIGVDSGIHIALRERRAPGAVFATSTPRAVVFSALTTMAAFATLALSDHRGTASMGVLLVVAMTAAVGSVLALTPALIRWTRGET